MKKVVVLVLAAALLLLGFFFIRKYNRALLVETAAVERKDLLLTIDASGRVEASQSAELKFETSGKIVWLPFAVGDKVEKWQGVAALDKSALEVAFNQARANWVKYALAQEQLSEDYKDVWHDPAIRRTTGQSQATVDYYWSALQAADLALKKAVLTSPLSGTVVSLNKKLGEYVTVGETVMTVADLSELYFSANLDEADVGRVVVGQEAFFTLDAFPGEEFSGVVGEIAPQAIKDENGDTVFPVKIFPAGGTGAGIRLGMSGEARIVKEEARGVLAISFEALARREGRSFVFVVEAGRVRRREVKLGLENEFEVEVRAGLSEGEKVVVAETGKMKEGMKVNY